MFGGGDQGDTNAKEEQSRAHGDSARVDGGRVWSTTKRGYLKTVSTLGVGGTLLFASNRNAGSTTIGEQSALGSSRRTNPLTTERTASRVGIDPTLTDIRGAIYVPSNAWNAWQQWAWYDPKAVEQELDMAALLGLNSLRVFASYEYWRDAPTSFRSRMDHFLTACNQRGIRPLMILFEAAPKSEPTEANRTATDPTRAFGVHSPSREHVLWPRRWDGWDRSPVAFAADWATRFASDSRVLATEIMNEPGNVQPRRDFVVDVLRTVRERAPEAALTMGCKNFQFNPLYDFDDELDIYQFHMNLPDDAAAAKQYLASAHRFRRETEKPLWCTEWQRTLTDSSNRFLPDYKSLASIIHDAHDEGSIDGDFFWSLMLKLAWLKRPRERGRVNGVFHPDGSVFDLLDAAAISGLDLSLSERRELPTPTVTTERSHV